MMEDNKEDKSKLEAEEDKSKQELKEDKTKGEPRENNDKLELKQVIAEQAIEGEAPLSSNFSLRKILGGDILTARIIRRQIWLVILVVFSSSFTYPTDIVFKRLDRNRPIAKRTAGC